MTPGDWCCFSVYEDVPVDAHQQQARDARHCATRCSRTEQRCTRWVTPRTIWSPVVLRDDGNVWQICAAQCRDGICEELVAESYVCSRGCKIHLVTAKLARLVPDTIARIQDADAARSRRSGVTESKLEVIIDTKLRPDIRTGT